MLNKRMYIKPVLESETFVPQNYVAACGDSGKIYKFTCDGGGGRMGDVYTSSGENLTEGKMRYYHACNTKHSAPSDDEFIRGTFIANGGNDEKRHWVSDGWFGGGAHGRLSIYSCNNLDRWRNKCTLHRKP